MSDFGLFAVSTAVVARLSFLLLQGASCFNVLLACLRIHHNVRPVRGVRDHCDQPLQHQFGDNERNLCSSRRG